MQQPVSGKLATGMCLCSPFFRAMCNPPMVCSCMHLDLCSGTLPDRFTFPLLRSLACRIITAADLSAAKMGGGAMVSGPSFDNERVAMYEGKTTVAGEERISVTAQQQ